MSLHDSWDPAEAAMLVVLIGLGLSAFSLFWVGRVVALRRRQKQTEWLMQERLARWRKAVETQGVQQVAGARDLATSGPER